MVTLNNNLLIAQKCVHIFIKKVFRLNNINFVKYFNYKTISNAACTTDININNNIKDFHLNVVHTHSNNDDNHNIKLTSEHYQLNTNHNLFDNERNYKLIDSCKDVYDFVRIVNELGSLTKGEMVFLARKATQLISNDMKQNSILLITLTQFRIDIKQFLDKLSNIEITNNVHIILRSLSESEINPDVYNDHLKERINKIYDNYFNKFCNNNCIAEDVADHIYSDDKLKYMEKYNYICSYCKFISMKLISNLGHMNLIESYINSCNTDNLNELDNYTVQQLVDICYNLALVNSETCRIVLDKLDSKNFYKIVQYSELIQMFTKVASFDENNRFGNVETLILEMYKGDGFKLQLEECVNILVAIGRSRKCGVMLIDRVVHDIKNYTNELELQHIIKILINLSKVNYNNRGFVRHMANIMLTFVDEDAILDPFTMSNTIKSFGRFKYYNESLMKILMSIMEKEEVLAEFEIHDLVTIFTSLTKIVSSNTVNKININRYFRILANKISKTDINTETAMKLINASGRIRYNYERFLNTLIESINLNEVDNLSKLCKLKINCDKLTLYYPELTRRIQELERAFRPVKDDEVDTDEQSEGKSIIEEQDIEDYERTICVRRNVMYRDLKLPSVRKRKWTY